MFQMVQALENPLDFPDPNQGDPNQGDPNQGDPNQGDHDHADDPSDPSLSQLDTLRRLFDVSIVTNAQK